MSENLSGGYAICFNQWLFDERIQSELRLLLLITSLSAKEGYCYASNQYLAEKLNKSKDTISAGITKLKKYGYIETEEEKFGAAIINRKIRVIVFERIAEFQSANGENKAADGKNKDANGKNSVADVKNPSDAYIGRARMNNTSQENYKPYELQALCVSASATHERNEAPRSPEFQKPTIEQIKAYCQEANKNIDAEAFFDFYEAKGWVVGRAPMKDWKAAVRNWAKNESQFLRRKVNEKGEEVGSMGLPLSQVSEAGQWSMKNMAELAEYYKSQGR